MKTSTLIHRNNATKLKKLLLAWLVVSATLMLYSCATTCPKSSADVQKTIWCGTWCGWDFQNIKYMKPKQIEDCLKKAKADPCVRNNERETPLHYAARGGSAKAMGHLLKAGANPNAKSWYGHTPLHFAALGGSAEAVKCLLIADADLTAENWHGHTPLDYAKSAEVLKLMLDARADSCAKNGYENILHKLCKIESSSKCVRIQEAGGVKHLLAVEARNNPDRD